MKKTISILGSTGSIGKQALEVVAANNYQLKTIVANSSVALLEQQAREYSPKTVVVRDESCYKALKTALSDTAITVQAGQNAIDQAAAEKTDVILNAIVGIAGLSSTMAALKGKNTLALANKESLVTAGELVKKTARENSVEILPVDSEHSAIFQCLNGENSDRIEKILLTASGGPFFGKTKEELQGVTLADALKHPNWSMGQKITIDSATLMNKGLEFIEAMVLFDVLPQQIEVLVHRQSIVHSAVEFSDGAIIAQLGSADMRLPIQYALTYPERLPCKGNKISLAQIATLTFATPDDETFICLKAAKRAAELGGLYPCAINGANEKAVELFVKGEISFLDIGKLVYSALELDCNKKEYNINDVYYIDTLAREHVLKLAKSK